MSVRRAPRTERLGIAGPEGRLEALLDTAGTGDTHTAVVCHPHPAHGGTMHNKVTYTLARSFYRCGAAALRFDYRGVGGSAGSYAGGPGEIEDARAALAYLRRRWPDRPIYLGGFAFGAMVALGVAQRDPLAALVTVAPPAERIPTACERPDCPWLVIQGQDDEVVDAAAVEPWAMSFDPVPELAMLPGVGHFFDGELGKLREIVTRFLETG